MSDREPTAQQAVGAAVVGAACHVIRRVGLAAPYAVPHEARGHTHIAPQPGRVTLGPGKDDAHGCRPGPRTDRPLGRFHRRWPQAREQVTHQLDLADCSA
jgi:hypothetical protein